MSTHNFRLWKTKSKKSRKQSKMWKNKSKIKKSEMLQNYDILLFFAKNNLCHLKLFFFLV